MLKKEAPVHTKIDRTFRNAMFDFMENIPQIELYPFSGVIT